MLHTVNKSPFTNGTLESCLRFCQPGDALLLLEDGVLAASAGTAKSNLVAKAMENGHEVYAISADIKARGLHNLIEGVKVVGYDVFVDLVEKNKIHSWL